MDQPPPQPVDQFPPLRPQVVAEPVAAQPRRKSAFLRFVWALLVLVLLGSLGINLILFLAVGVLSGGGGEDGRVQEKFVGGNRHGPDKVAILSVEGTILSGEGFFKQQIDHARADIEDGTLKAIVVRVNSPGGTIGGSDYMLHHLQELGKLKAKGETKPIPIVVSMGETAASGGYYLSMCVGDTPESIFAEPTTWTGSIGVLIPHYDLAQLMDKCGIMDDSIASNPLKTMGSMARKMTPKEREIFQALVNDGFTRFKEVVKLGRPGFRRDPAALDKLATGQVFTAKQALANGLVDRIGFVEDAVDRVIALANLDKDNVKIVKYKAERGLSEVLFGRSQAQPAISLKSLLQAATPKAYYLCTWLPALASSDP